MRNGERSSAGFSLPVMLVVLALAALAASVVVQRWTDTNSREREQHLLLVGDLYAKALDDYHRAAPGGQRQYPQRLQQLLDDDRFVGVRRHLRELYPDPITGRQDWTLVTDSQGGIIGVRSASVARPWLSIGKSLRHVDLAPATRYSEWLFTPRDTHRSGS